MTGRRSSVNIYAPNMGSPKYIKQLMTNIKELIDNNTIIVGDFNTPLTSMNISPKKKLNKEKIALNDTLQQMDLTDGFIPKQKNTHSFQVHMEHSPEYIKHQPTKQTSTNSRRSKSYHAYILTTPL